MFPGVSSCRYEQTWPCPRFSPFFPPGVDVHPIDGLSDEPKLHEIAEHEAAGTEVHEPLKKGRDGQNNLTQNNTTRLFVNSLNKQRQPRPKLCVGTTRNISQQEVTDTGCPPRLVCLGIMWRYASKRMPCLLLAQAMRHR